jgi:hypothetical protein
MKKLEQGSYPNCSLQKNKTYSFHFEFDKGKCRKLTLTFNPDRSDLYRYYLEYRRSWAEEYFHSIENKTLDSLIQEQRGDIEKFIKDKYDRELYSLQTSYKNFAKMSTVVVEILEKDFK